MTRIKKSYLFLLLWWVAVGCQKDFLNKNPSTSLVVPSTLTDYQNLLNNDKVMNGTPVLGELSADDCYLLPDLWQGLDTREHNAYIWAVDIYQGQGLVDDWDAPYKQVFYANVILEGLQAIARTADNSSQWFSEQGSAFFIRAYAFYNLAQLFAPVYDSLTAGTDLGIPLRLHSDVTAPSVRSSVSVTYDQILSDLRQAALLLPAVPATASPNLPSRPAALAMLARVCLSMGAYTQAGLYADSCLQLDHALIDYNGVSPFNPLPFNHYAAEVLYQSSILSYTQALAALAYPGCIVDSGLYRSYDATDLRRSVFYMINGNGQVNIKGGYGGTIYPFTGLAVDEVYLIRAEAAARQGFLQPAMADLDTLRRYRYKGGVYPIAGAASQAAAIDTVLADRRKELSFRGLRWTDLRRLAREGRTDTLHRNLNGVSYSLPPGDLRYTLPIPPDILSDNPGMQQNMR